MEPYGSMGTTSGGNTTTSGGNGGATSTSARGEGLRREGDGGRAIERRISKVPSDLFLWAAGASIVASAVFQVIGGRRGRFQQMRATPTQAPMASFIGMWVPSLLLLGVYRKIVQVASQRDRG